MSDLKLGIPGTIESSIAEHGQTEEADRQLRDHHKPNTPVARCFEGNGKKVQKLSIPAYSSKGSRRRKWKNELVSVVNRLEPMRNLRPSKFD